MEELDCRNCVNFVLGTDGCFDSCDVVKEVVLKIESDYKHYPQQCDHFDDKENYED